MKLVKNYMVDDAHRLELSRLAKETFGVDIERWYQSGGDMGQYVPYSIFSDDGKILSNVSVNIMDCMLFGKKKHYIQLGTVMTDPEHRGKGYAADLIHAAAEDLRDCEGIYLYGNDKAAPFYKKMGFTGGREYECIMSFAPENGACGFKKLDPMDSGSRMNYIKALRAPAVNYALQPENPGLIIFHTNSLENCYYSEELDCYITATLNKAELHIDSLIAPKRVMHKDIIKTFGSGISSVSLGYTPLPDEINEFTVTEHKEEDCNFLFIGDDFKDFKEKKLRFPEFSHA